MRVLIFPGISLGSLVWWLGAFALVPLFTILGAALFWSGLTFGLLAFRTIRRTRKRRRAESSKPEEPEAEQSVRSRLESLP